MSARLHLTPIGLDKTALTLSLLRQFSAAEKAAFPTIWVLLATRRQEMQFRQGLIEDATGGPAYFNIEFFSFYTLNARLLKLAGTPVRRLSSLMRHRILRQLLSELLAEGRLNFFDRIAETRGFASILLELIDELKQNKIEAADLAKLAGSPKDKDIAAIYQRYQDTLRESDLADVEGEGWLALATLQRRNAIAAAVDLLLVDGYDQFTPVQAQLLAELSRALSRAHITLTAPPDEESAHLPSRSALARQRLQGAFDAAGVSLSLHRVDDAPRTRHRELQRLGRDIFRDVPGSSGGEAIKLMAMPDPAEEARSVLREVKRLLHDGVPADSVLIALRDWERYAGYFESAGDEYALPLLLHHERLSQRAPVIAVFIDLLELAPRFRRRDLLDVLRSPYVDAGLDDSLIDRLNRLSLEQRFLGGSEADWLALIGTAAQNRAGVTDDEALTMISAEQANALTDGLSQFFKAITPPERAELPWFVGWLGGLLGSDPGALTEENDEGYSLNIIENAWKYDRENRAIVDRDIHALNGLKAALRNMLRGDDVLRAALRTESPKTWQQFWSDLKYALETGVDDFMNQPRRDQVLVTTAAEARGLPHDHVFIPGLAEGVFPAEAAEDPLYLDSEREQLQARGIALETRAERIDDRGLFYELIGLPRQSLTLSRPTYQAGRQWVESYLWRAVTAVFPGAPIQSRAVGAVIQPQEAANSAELTLAVADKLGQADAAEAELALRARNWLRANPSNAEPWRRLESNRAVELGRLSDAPFDQYSGILARRATRLEAGRHLSEQRVFSATRLKDYGLCAFRYFAKRMLMLEEVKEPEAGADALQLGLLNHSILERTYKRIAEQGLPIQEENLPRALEIFKETSARILDTAPADFNFRASASWSEERQLIVLRLAALIKLDFSSKSPLNRFGVARKAHLLEHKFDDVRIPLPDATAPLRVRGTIDRIDIADGKLIVVDYKSGSTPIDRGELESGRDFQMLIYAEAMAHALAEADDERQVTGGMFWHLRNLKASGVISTDDEGDIAALDGAKAHIARNLKTGRAGQFPAQASKLEQGKCARYCEYVRFCRLHATGRFKPLPDIDEKR